MKTKSFVLATIILIGFLVSPSMATTNQLKSNSGYLSIHAGGFIISQSGFSNTYGSNLGPAFGVGLGLALTTHLFLCTKASYFTKQGTPLWVTYGFTNGKSTIISESRNGSANFREWILDGGMKYDFFISKPYNLGLEGGITVITFADRAQSANGQDSFQDNGEGAFGFYAGLSLERRFKRNPFAVFADAQYNYALKNVATAVGNYGGMSLSLGVRYYFGGIIGQWK